MSRPTVLVTGGTGLVGCAIQRQTETLESYNFVFVCSKDADLTDVEQTKALFQRFKPDFVVHLAARVGGVYRNSRIEGGERVKMLSHNVAMNTNIVNCCEEFNVTRAMLCLSTCVFPDIPPQGYPFDENALHQGAPHPSNEGYAHAKRLMELHSRLLNEESPEKKRYICVIPTNVYGPNDNYNLEDSHVIPGLIHRAYLAAEHDLDFAIRGSGSAIRQFIHADDLAKRMIHLLLKTNVTGSVIATSDVEYSIRQIVELVADSFEIPRDRIVFDTSFADGQRRKTSSGARMKEILPDMPFIGIEEGISQSVEWFVDNFDNLRK
jgi:GDP-L-fucose synthase